MFKTLILDSVNKTITAKLNGAITTSQPVYTSHWGDDVGANAAFEEGSANGVLNSTTLVTLVVAPASGDRRLVRELTIVNIDTVAAIVLLYLSDSGTDRLIARVSLGVNEYLTTDGAFDTTGALKTVIGTVPAGLITGIVAVANGGTGQDFSASTGTIIVTAGVMSANTNTGTGNSVRATSPTLTTPTIADFTNATHNHSSTTNGGQITDAALSTPVGTAKGGLGGDFSASSGSLIISSGTVTANSETGTGNSVRATSPTITGPVITGGSINNTPIGATTPNTLAGTSLFVAPSGSIDASAVAQADSTTKGLLPPRMTTTQRNAISSPANGLTLYDSTLNRPASYVNGNWMPYGIYTITPRTVLGSDQASISITLPSIFNEAWIRLEARSDYGTGTVDNLFMQFNGDTTAANYYTEYTNSTATTPAAAETLGSVAGILIGLSVPCNTATAGNGILLVKIVNYLSTSLRRGVSWDGGLQQGTGTGTIRYISGTGWWQNTSNAITTVVFKPALGANLKTGSAYSVLGVF